LSKKCRENPGYAPDSGDLARGFSDLKMTWLHYCADAATAWQDPAVALAELRPGCAAGSRVHSFEDWFFLIDLAGVACPVGDG